MAREPAARSAGAREADGQSGPLREVSPARRAGAVPARDGPRSRREHGGGLSGQAPCRTGDQKGNQQAGKEIHLMGEALFGRTSLSRTAWKRALRASSRLEPLTKPNVVQGKG